MYPPIYRCPKCESPSVLFYWLGGGLTLVHCTRCNWTGKVTWPRR